MSNTKGQFPAEMASLVYNYLNTVDKGLALAFQRKTKAKTLVDDSPNIFEVFSQASQDPSAEYCVQTNKKNKGPKFNLKNSKKKRKHPKHFFVKRHPIQDHESSGSISNSDDDYAKRKRKISSTFQDASANVNAAECQQTSNSVALKVKNKVLPNPGAFVSNIVQNMGEDSDSNGFDLPAKAKETSRKHTLDAKIVSDGTSTNKVEGEHKVIDFKSKLSKSNKATEVVKYLSGKRNPDPSKQETSSDTNSSSDEEPAKPAYKIQLKDKKTKSKNSSSNLNSACDPTNKVEGEHKVISIHVKNTPSKYCKEIGKTISCEAELLKPIIKTPTDIKKVLFKESPKVKQKKASDSDSSSNEEPSKSSLKTDSKTQESRTEVVPSNKESSSSNTLKFLEASLSTPQKAASKSVENKLKLSKNSESHSDENALIANQQMHVTPKQTPNKGSENVLSESMSETPTKTKKKKMIDYHKTDDIKANKPQFEQHPSKSARTTPVKVNLLNRSPYKKHTLKDPKSDAAVTSQEASNETDASSDERSINLTQKSPTKPTKSSAATALVEENKDSSDSDSSCEPDGTISKHKIQEVSSKSMLSIAHQSTPALFPESQVALFKSDPIEAQVFKKTPEKIQTVTSKNTPIKCTQNTPLKLDSKVVGKIISDDNTNADSSIKIKSSRNPLKVIEESSATQQRTPTKANQLEKKGYVSVADTEIPDVLTQKTPTKFICSSKVTSPTNIPSSSSTNTSNDKQLSTKQSTIPTKVVLMQSSDADSSNNTESRLAHKPQGGNKDVVSGLSDEEDLENAESLRARAQSSAGVCNLTKMLESGCDSGSDVSLDLGQKLPPTQLSQSNVAQFSDTDTKTVDKESPKAQTTLKSESKVVNTKIQNSGKESDTDSSSSTEEVIPKTSLSTKLKAEPVKTKTHKTLKKKNESSDSGATSDDRSLNLTPLTEKSNPVVPADKQMFSLSKIISNKTPEKKCYPDSSSDEQTSKLTKFSHSKITPNFTNSKSLAQSEYKSSTKLKKNDESSDDSDSSISDGTSEQNTTKSAQKKLRFETDTSSEDDSKMYSHKFPSKTKPSKAIISKTKALQKQQMLLPNTVQKHQAEKSLFKNNQSSHDSESSSDETTKVSSTTPKMATKIARQQTSTDDSDSSPVRNTSRQSPKVLSKSRATTNTITSLRDQKNTFTQKTKTIIKSPIKRNKDASNNLPDASDSSESESESETNLKLLSDHEVDAGNLDKKQDHSLDGRTSSDRSFESKTKLKPRKQFLKNKMKTKDKRNTSLEERDVTELGNTESEKNLTSNVRLKRKCNVESSPVEISKKSPVAPKRRKDKSINSPSKKRRLSDGSVTVPLQKKQAVINKDDTDDETDRTPRPISDQQAAAKAQVAAFKCSICDKNLSTPSGLRRHTKNHTRKENVVTPTKRRGSKSEYEKNGVPSEAELHIADHNKSTERTPKADRETAQKSCQCSVCGKAFTTVSNRNRHLKIHTQQKDAVHSKTMVGAVERKGNVSEDQKKSDKKDLSAASDNEESFDCNFCERTLSTAKQLKRHLKGHAHKVPQPVLLDERVSCKEMEEDIESVSNCSEDAFQLKSSSTRNDDKENFERTKKKELNDDESRMESEDDQELVEIEERGKAKKEQRNKNIMQLNRQSLDEDSKHKNRKQNKYKEGGDTKVEKIQHSIDDEYETECNQKETPKTQTRKHEHECLVCEKLLLYLKQHQKTHMDGGKLSTHLQMVPNETADTSDVSEKLLHDPLNIDVYRNKQDVKNITNDKIHKCTVCQKLLSNSSSLKRHIKTHSVEAKPLKTRRRDSVITDQLLHDKFEDGISGTPEEIYKELKKRQSKNHSAECEVSETLHNSKPKSHTGFTDKSTNGTESINKKHRRNSVYDKLYKCLVCDKQLASSSSLKRHSKVHTVEDKDPGNTDKTNNSSDSENSSHETNTESTKARTKLARRKSISDKLYNCTVCDKQLASSSSLKRHSKVHTVEAKDPVTPHKTNSSSDSEYSKHVTNTQSNKVHTKLSRKGISDNLYKCLVCDKQLASSSSLKRHLKVHSVKDKDPVTPHKINTSSESDDSEDVINTEYSKPNDKVARRKSVSDKLYKCLVCDKEYASSSSYTHHLKVHSKENKVTPHKTNTSSDSEDSSHETNTKSTEAHAKLARRNSISDKLYTCLVCDKQLASSSSLKRHSKVHSVKDKDHVTRHKTNLSSESEESTHESDKVPSNSDTKAARRRGIEKVHKCAVCGKQFDTVSSFEYHAKIHRHESRQIREELPKKSKENTTPASKAFSHLRKLDGVSPFECAVCNEVFSTTSNLQRHMKQHGKDELLSGIDAEHSKKKKKLTQKHSSPEIPSKKRKFH